MEKQNFEALDKKIKMLQKRFLSRLDGERTKMESLLGQRGDRLFEL